MKLYNSIGPNPRISLGGAEQGAFMVSPLDLLGPIAVGGLWLWWFIGLLRRTSLEPIHDPNQCETEAEHA